MEKIRECPFCGLKKELIMVKIDKIEKDGKNWPDYFVWCNKCEIRGPKGGSRKMAKEFWNERNAYYDPVRKRFQEACYG